jgi:hypothetical protein
MVTTCLFLFEKGGGIMEKIIEQLITNLIAAGKNLTVEEISETGFEVEEQFGINRNIIMLILLSGKDGFKEYAIQEMQKIA